MFTFPRTVYDNHSIGTGVLATTNWVKLRVSMYPLFKNRGIIAPSDFPVALNTHTLTIMVVEHDHFFVPSRAGERMVRRVLPVLPFIECRECRLTCAAD
jgi:hypothetical protein